MGLLNIITLTGRYTTNCTLCIIVASHSMLLMKLPPYIIVMIVCTWKCEYSIITVVVLLHRLFFACCNNYISWLKFHCNFCAVLAIVHEGFFNLLCGRVHSLSLSKERLI